MINENENRVIFLAAGMGYGDIQLFNLKDDPQESRDLGQYSVYAAHVEAEL